MLILKKYIYMTASGLSKYYFVNVSTIRTNYEFKINSDKHDTSQSNRLVTTPGYYTRRVTFDTTMILSYFYYQGITLAIAMLQQKLKCHLSEVKRPQYNPKRVRIVNPNAIRVVRSESYTCEIKETSYTFRPLLISSVYIKTPSKDCIQKKM